MKNLEAITECVTENGITVERIKPLPELERFEGRYVAEITRCPHCGAPDIYRGLTDSNDEADGRTFSVFSPKRCRPEVSAPSKKSTIVGLMVGGQDGQ